MVCYQYFPFDYTFYTKDDFKSSIRFEILVNDKQIGQTMIIMVLLNI